MSRTALRWRHPQAGLYVLELDEHTFAVHKNDVGLWLPEVDGKPLGERHQKASTAQMAAVLSLMPDHRIVPGRTGYCEFSEGLPAGWSCEHDQFWYRHIGRS